MRVVICGSRSENDSKLIEMSVAESGFDITEVISGGAKGIDTRAVEWAVENDIEVTVFEADWNNLDYPDAIIKTTKWGQKFDARAGLRRNELMAVYAEGVIAIWDGKSKGTKHMIAMARKRELPIFVYRTDFPYKTGFLKHETKREFYARLSKIAVDNGW
jgi:predicted Rossmann fold nucleotide-binding protein DprA/Smf involved in DNA uptake